MLRRLAPVLLAVLFALVATLPLGGRAMSLAAGTAGTAMHQHCASCPSSRSDTAPDKMPACQVLACAGAVAVLPTAAWLPGRILLGTVHPQPLARQWIGALPAPDPFPPSPIALV